MLESNFMGLWGGGLWGGEEVQAMGSKLQEILHRGEARGSFSWRPFPPHGLWNQLPLASSRTSVLQLSVLVLPSPNPVLLLWSNQEFRWSIRTKSQTESNKLLYSLITVQLRSQKSTHFLMFHFLSKNSMSEGQVNAVQGSVGQTGWGRRSSPHCWWAPNKRLLHHYGPVDQGEEKGEESGIKMYWKWRKSTSDSKYRGLCLEAPGLGMRVMVGSKRSHKGFWPGLDTSATIQFISLLQPNI